MRGFLMLLIAVFGSIGVGVAAIDAAAAPGGGAPVAVRSVRSISVPRDDVELLANGRRLEVSGCEDGSDGALLVEPATLTLLSMGCSNFPPGQRVALRTVPTAGVNAIDSCHPESQGVTPIRLGATISGEVGGSVVLRYAGNCSTTRPTTVYAGGSLWVYDCSAGASGRDGQIVRLSATTGAVENSITMPAVCWTSFGADADGAFVASYDNSGPIYFVAPGAQGAVVVLRTSGRVNWFYGSGDSVYAGVGAAGGSCAPVACGIWRFDGPSATPHLLVEDRDVDDIVATPAGGSSVGLFSAVLVGAARPDPSRFELVWIDPGSGAMDRLATVHIGGPYGGPPSLAYSDGALFVLYEGTLYRYELS